MRYLELHSKVLDIKKVKIKDLIEVEIEYDEIVKHNQKAFTINRTFHLFKEPHRELTDWFVKLKLHLAYLCEMIPVGKYNAEYDNWMVDETISKLEVTGFSIGGHDEYLGVTLIGKRRLNNNRVLNLVAPFTRYEDENAQYIYGFELEQLINSACQEVESYMEGKFAPEKQTELELK